MEGITIICPVCKSENVVDVSAYQNNGIFGPGSASWKVSDMRSCEDCGVLFRPVPSTEKKPELTGNPFEEFTKWVLTRKWSVFIDADIPKESKIKILHHLGRSSDLLDL